jgi:hypothetical protein
MVFPMEVYMPSDSLPDLSPEQEFAHKLAAQELAKYCQEFSRWRIRKRGRAASEKSQRVQGMLIPPPLKKPDPRAPLSSA